MRLFSNKNHLKTFLFSSLIGVASSSVVHAEVTLNIEENIKVTAINGTAVNTGFFSNPKMQYTLAAGNHVITAKYNRLYRLQGDNHDYLRSSNITINTNLADNTTYKLVMLDQPEEYEEARKYAENPVLAIKKGDSLIITKNGSANTETSSSLSAIRGLFSSGNQQAALENSKVIAAVKNSAVANMPNQLESNNQESSNQRGNALDSFMQLWLQATPEEREKIRAWIEK